MSNASRKETRLKRNQLRGDAHQQATLAQRLSEFNLEGISTASSEGATLISSLQEATRITLAAETTHTMRAKEHEAAKNEYGDRDGGSEEVDMSDIQAITRASLLQMPADEVSRAKEKVKIARDQLEKIRCDLKELVEGSLEVDDSLVALLEEMKLED